MSYESIGKGGLDVCTRARGREDILGEGDCCVGVSSALRMRGVMSCSMSSGVTTKMPGVVTVASCSS